MESKKRQQILLVIILVIVGLWAGYQLAFTRVSTVWKARSARIDQLRTQLSQGRSLLQREDVVRGRWEYLRRNSLPSNTSAAAHSQPASSATTPRSRYGSSRAANCDKRWPK